METSLIAICYVLGIGVEVGLIFVKWKAFLALPVIAFSITFLCLRDPMWLFIAIIDLFIAALGICTQLILDAKAKKRKASAEEKTKIKDL